MELQDYSGLKVSLLWCYDSREQGRDVESETRTYENHAAWLVRSGWAEVRHDRQVCRALPGEWLIVKSGPRFQRFGSHTQLLSVAFEASWPDGTQLLEEGLSTVLKGSEYPELEETATPLVRRAGRLLPDGQWELLQQPGDCVDYLEITAGLTSWLACLLRVLERTGIHPKRSQVLDQRVLRAVRVVESRSREARLDLDSVARTVGLSNVHLSRLFRRELNSSPHAYWNRLRVEYACRRLGAKGSRASEIALELGFRHLSHFSSWFKSNVGMSPREFSRT